MGRIVVKVYIVRHGETDENRKGIMQGQLDTQLNAAGVEQAQMAANALERVQFKKAFSSDLDRAVKTAEIIIAKHPGVALETKAELRERHLGDWQGQTITTRGSTAPANAEPVSDFSLRAARWWKTTILGYAQSVLLNGEERTDPACVLAVSHGGYISRLIANLVELDGVKVAEGVAVNSKCWNASISVIDIYEDGESELVTYSDTTHLKVDLVQTNADVITDK